MTGIPGEAPDAKALRRALIVWRRIAYLLAMLVVVGLLSSGLVLWAAVRYTDRMVGQMCGLMNVLSDNDPPPTTERGRTVAAEIDRLRHAYHCDNS